jgi:hypothetical protein
MAENQGLLSNEAGPLPQYESDNNDHHIQREPQYFQPVPTPGINYSLPTVYYGFKDHCCLLSIVFSLLFFVCFSWLALLCSVPAIFFSINAQIAEKRGDRLFSNKNRYISIALNMCGIGTYVSQWLVYLALIIWNVLVPFHYAPN